MDRRRVFPGGATLKPWPLVLCAAVFLTAPAGADFSPPEISGLKLWIKADVGVTKDEGNRISGWADQSGQGNDFAQTNRNIQPTMADGVVRFDGVDDALELARPVNPSGGSVFAVVRWSAVKGYSFAIGLDRGTDGYLRMSDDRTLLTGGFYPVLFQNMIACPKDCPSGYGKKVFHFVPSRLTTWNLYAVTDNPPGKDAIKWLGQNEMNNTPGNRFAGDIAELLIYDRPLPMAERVKVEEYLGRKWLTWPALAGIPVSGLSQPTRDALWAEPKVSQSGVGEGTNIFHGFSNRALGPGRYRLALQFDGEANAASTHRYVHVRIGDQTMLLSAVATNATTEFELPVGAVPDVLLVRVSSVFPVAVRGVQIEELCPVKVLRARTGKIFYKPGESASAEVSLVNTADNPQHLEVRCYEVTEFNERRRLGSQMVEVAVGVTNTFRFPFTVGRMEYGRDFQVELVQDDVVVEIASDPFGVADNVWKVAIGGNASGPVGSSALYSEQASLDQIREFRDHYVNCWEKYFWAPDDWGDLTPPAGATWVSCQARRVENTEKIKSQVEESHRLGIHVLTYGKCMAGGEHGWEMARAKPHWFLTDIYGRTMGRPADVWDFDHWQEAQQFKYRDFKYDWTYRWVDLRRLDALDYGIDELIASTKQFGWDGVRFDSGGFRAHFVDGLYNGYDPVNTRNMKRLKERLWKAYPDFLFGYNTDNTIAKDRAYPLRVEEMSHEMREMLAGGGLWMGEAIKGFSNGSITYKMWSQCASDESKCVRAVKQAGGYFCYLFHTGSSVRNAYQFAIGVMIGAHPYGGEHVAAPGSESWGRFLTRWSGLLWDHRLRPLENTGQVVTVLSPRPLWWKEYANERVLSPKRKQIIVHLLNPPLEDEIAKAGDTFPEPVDGCTVSLRVPSKQKIAHVWFISPGKPNRAELLPAKNGMVTVPRFDLWAMVVFELDGKFAMPADAPRFTEPLSAQERADLERKTPTPTEKVPWFGLRPPAPTPNVATADNLLDPTPQHDPAIAAAEMNPSTNRAPSGLAVGGAAGLDVLIVNGFYYKFHRVAEAIRAASPQARIVECTTRDLPKGHAAVSQYDIIVLVDMGADAWDRDGQQQLVDFVEAGGRLAILGGPFTLGQGNFGGSLLAKLLPVDVRPARDVYELPKPLALGDGGLVYFVHAARPVEGALTLLKADELPILIERKVGKGSTLVFLGTMLGEPRPGETPFWASGNWPSILGRALLGSDPALTSLP